MNTLTRTITIDLGDRERQEAANSRRFPVSVSSDAPVPRRDWATGEMFGEVLSHEGGAVDLSRAPLPVLEGHDRSRAPLGIVTSLRLDGGRLRGELVMGSTQRALELSADIADGIVTGLSVGYQITREERDEKAKRITATRWMPFEVSIVSIPADTSVGINRSANMDPTTATPSTQPATPAPTDPARDAASPEVLAERQRIEGITNLVRMAHLGNEVARGMIQRGVALETARAAIHEELVRRDEAIPSGGHLPLEELTSSRSPVTPGNDYAQDFHRAAVDALLLRAGIHLAKPHAAAQDVSASVHDLARLCLSRSGKPASRWFGGEARGPELIKRAMSTSDFPAILAGALHMSVRTGYESEPASHRAWVRPVPVADFTDQVRPILGSAPGLQQVNEGGEYEDGSLTDDTAKYQVAKYGVLASITWEALVNDQLGAWMRIQPALGQAARRKEADAVYALFALNTAAGPTMQDGTALFHANHANLTASAAFDAAQLGAGRALLRKQTAVGGGYLSLVPRYLIVPSERETAAEVLLANATRRMTTEKTTPEWIASLELVVEPRLANTGVYLAADSAQIDHCELGLLEENLNGPVIEEEQEFRRDARRWKVRHVFGVKFLDWRGIVKMPVT